MDKVTAQIDYVLSLSKGVYLLSLNFFMSVCKQPYSSEKRFKYQSKLTRDIVVIQKIKN